MTGGLLIIAALLMFYDLRDQLVPTILVALFGSFLFIKGLEAPHWDALFIGVGFSLISLGCEVYWKRPLVGMADKILLPILMLNIPLIHLGNYLMAVGIIGAIIAIVWQKLYQTEQFPFLPALITPIFFFI